MGGTGERLLVMCGLRSRGRGWGCVPRGVRDLVEALQHCGAVEALANDVGRGLRQARGMLLVGLEAGVGGVRVGVPGPVAVDGGAAGVVRRRGLGLGLLGVFLAYGRGGSSSQGMRVLGMRGGASCTGGGGGRSFGETSSASLTLKPIRAHDGVRTRLACLRHKANLGSQSNRIAPQSRPGDLRRRKAVVERDEQSYALLADAAQSNNWGLL